MKTHDMQSSVMETEVGKATEAIRRALSGLEPGTSLALDDVFAAFVAVRQVTELRMAEQTAHARAGQPGAALNRALTEYRSALIDWDRHLPRVHGWLLAERARLSSRRAHAGSVQTWIETDRQTREPRSTK